MAEVMACHPSSVAEVEPWGRQVGVEVMQIHLDYAGRQNMKGISLKNFLHQYFTLLVLPNICRDDWRLKLQMQELDLTCAWICTKIYFI